jgi:hypothetical protein
MTDDGLFHDITVENDALVENDLTVKNCLILKASPDNYIIARTITPVDPENVILEFSKGLRLKETCGTGDWIDIQTKSINNDLFLEISNSIRLSSIATCITRLDLVSKIWGFDNGFWMPQYLTIPHGMNYIRFMDTNTEIPEEKRGHYGDLALITLSDNNYDPILTWSEGMIVKKDFSAGGFVAANQGLIALGHGMQNQFDPPGIWLRHSEMKKIIFLGEDFPTNPQPNWQAIKTNESPRRLYQYNGSTWIKQQDSGYDIDATNHAAIRFGGDFPTVTSEDEGYLFIKTPEYHLRKYDGSSWDDLGDINAEKFAGFYDTCYVRRAGYSISLDPNHPEYPLLQNGNLAHLSCQDLHASNIYPQTTQTGTLGEPQRAWLGVCVQTVYTEAIKHLDGSDWNFLSGSITHSQISDWGTWFDQYLTTSSSPTFSGLTVSGNANISGYAQFNNDAKLAWVNTATLAVQDADGVTANGGLDVGSVFVNNLQPLNSGSPAGININCPLSIGGSRGTAGQVLTSNGSSTSPTWQTLSLNQYAQAMDQYIRTTDTPTFSKLNLSTTGSSGGIAIGGDFPLYRVSACTAATKQITSYEANNYDFIEINSRSDSVLNIMAVNESSAKRSLTIHHRCTGQPIIQAYAYDGSTYYTRLYLNYDGQMRLPNQGSSAGLLVGNDVLWYRGAENLWQTPDSVKIEADLIVLGSIGDTTGYLSTAGVKFGTGYPVIGRNIISGNNVIEVTSGDMVFDGNVTVGRVDGGLSVNGVIGLTGDLSGNCFIQYGSGEGAIRLAKTASNVLSLQSQISGNWYLAVLNTAQTNVDHINSASGGGIYIFDTLRFGYPTADTTLYRSTTDTLKTDDNFIVQQNLWCNNLAVNTDIGVSGKITSTNGVVSNGVAIGYAQWGNLQWAYESIQLPYNYNLRINFASTEKYVFGNNGTFTVNNGNILPSSANNGNIGTNTQYWGSMWTNFLRYKNISSFDALDDLTLAKNYRVLTITEDGIQKEVVDPESLSFLKAEAQEPFFDNGKTTGFLLGCVKALVQRVENLELQLKGGKELD